MILIMILEILFRETPMIRSLGVLRNKIVGKNIPTTAIRTLGRMFLNRLLLNMTNGYHKG